MAIMGYFGTRNRRERHDIDIVNISQNDRLSQLDPSFFSIITAHHHAPVLAGHLD